MTRRWLLPLLMTALVAASASAQQRRANRPQLPPPMPMGYHNRAPFDLWLESTFPADAPAAVRFRHDAREPRRCAVATVAAQRREAGALGVIAPPALASVSPAAGTTAGGDYVSLEGFNFATGATVSFGGLPATDVTVGDCGYISVRTPAHPAGAVDVQVRNPDTQTSTLLNGFTYSDTPTANPFTVTGVAPNSGPTSGGTAITVTGINLPSDGIVYLDGRPATNVHWIDSTRMTASTPPGAVGLAWVEVARQVTPVEWQSSNDELFTYLPPAGPRPTISNFSPSSGSAGTAVTINGTNFVGVDDVRFPSLYHNDYTGTMDYRTAYASFDVISPAQIVAHVPPNAVSGPIMVHTVFGYAATCTSFTVPLPGLPVITGFPASANVNSVIAISGTNFNQITEVLFDGVPAYFYTYDSTSVRATVPVGARPGVLKVSNTSGTATSGTTFTPIYCSSTPAPTVSGFTPGSVAIGGSVTVNGENFNAEAWNDLVVRFGSGGTTNEYSGDGLSINVWEVPPTAVTGPVTVFTDQGFGSSANPLTVSPLPPPTISSLDTTSGNPGTRVHLYGTNLKALTNVLFYGHPTAFSSSGSTYVPISTSSGTVTGESPSGNAVGPAFTITCSAPTVTSINPTSGTPGTHIWVYGTNFGYQWDWFANEIFFGGVRYDGSAMSDPTVGGFTVPPGALTGPVVVQTPYGSVVGPEFTVTPAPPTITSFSPGTGSAGTSVVIRGTNFIGTSMVRFNGATAANYAIGDGTTLQATAPNGVTTGPISVTTPAGTATSSTSFTVLPPPTVTSVAPPSGPMAGNTAITITGTNFQAGATVSVGGAAATSVVVAGPTSITARTPAHETTGPVAVTVRNSSGGSGTLNDAFTYLPNSGAPTGVVATATAATVVRVTWNALPGATAYKVYRRAGGGGYSLVATVPVIAGAPPTYSYDDATASPATAYLYNVRAVVSGIDSGASTSDLATTVVFTDDPLVAGRTLIKALHLTELRTAADAVRSLAGLGGGTFTDADPSGTTVRSLHLLEVRSALGEALAALGWPALTFANPATAGTPVRAADFTELRDGMK